MDSSLHAIELQVITTGHTRDPLIDPRIQRNETETNGRAFKVLSHVEQAQIIDPISQGGVEEKHCPDRAYASPA